MADEILKQSVTTTYIGGNRVQIDSNGRIFEADQRTSLEHPDAGFCPLELVGAALGA
ncbi:MAG: hypothetical protein PVF47_12040 [Anaerolineae bacterium]|jgi:hypothetical protein